MIPGELIVFDHKFGIYGKLPYRSFFQLRKNDTWMYKFNRKLASPFNRTIKRKLKAGNKYLAKLGLPKIEMLDDKDLKRIRKHGDAPTGALLCLLPPDIDEWKLRRYSEKGITHE